MLDGDKIRVIRDCQDYSLEMRKKTTYLDSLLFKELTDQGIDVISCTVAMFDDCRKWNRDNFENYREIYLKVPIEELIRRDQKQLYSRALKHQNDNLMGINQEYEEPKEQDLIIENYGKNNVEQTVKAIIDKFNL